MQILYSIYYYYYHMHLVTLCKSLEKTNCGSGSPNHYKIKHRNKQTNYPLFIWQVLSLAHNLAS